MKITSKVQATVPQIVSGAHREVQQKPTKPGAELVRALRGKWRSKLGTDDVMRMTRDRS